MMSADLSNVYILSVQSHVVFGYVGNKVASFALQTSGLPTDTIDTVRFSNHSHYKNRTGDVLKSGEMRELIRGLRLNQLDCRYTHILSGYSYNDLIMSELIEIVAELKQNNPSLFYVCDPVLGDNGRLYVSESLVKVYRDETLAIADAVTPNQFEAELLANQSIQSESDVVQVLNKLHSLGPSIVIITSTLLPDHPNELIAYASRRSRSPAGQHMFEQWRIRIPEMKTYFVGTGDLFASCFLACWIKSGDLKKTFEHTVAAVQGTLKLTFDHATRLPGGIEVLANTELRLMDSTHHIRNPTVVHLAEQIKTP
jgi:pyridoxine kinase